MTLTDTIHTAADYTNNTMILKSATRISIPDAACSCPRCNIHADEGEVDAIFGFRNMKRLDSKGNVKRIERKVQSHCRECRKRERQAKAAAKRMAA